MKPLNDILGKEDYIVAKSHVKTFEDVNFCILKGYKNSNFSKTTNFYITADELSKCFANDREIIRASKLEKFNFKPESNLVIIEQLDKKLDKNVLYEQEKAIIQHVQSARQQGRTYIFLTIHPVSENLSKLCDLYIVKNE
jgi:hypothetical protein